ncbi:MAG TPA: hypothetical protein VFV95_18185 [Vicinamibacterales bacterium]|nr:hypothetical protein [Vicinamibacterales bacterium]
MSIRAAFVVVVVAIVFTVAVPARAQGPGQPPPNYQQLAAQLADLQARVAKLEGNIVASDLAGTYAVTILSTTMTAFRAGTPPINATINTAAARAALTLNADGTGNLTALSCEGSTLTQGPWNMHGFDCSEPPDSVTWVYANGIITITFLHDGDEIPFVVALGGRFFGGAAAPFHPGDPSSDQLLIIATRLR